MKKRIVSLFIVLTLLCTMIPQPVLSAEELDETAIYTQYLVNGGYADLVGYEIDKEYLNVSSCLIDIDKDGVRELLISLTDTEYAGPAGYQTFSALLDIQDGTVKTLLEAYYGGGTMGGDYLVLKYDNVQQTYVAALDGYIRDAVYASGVYLRVYSCDDFKVAYNIESHYYNLSMYEEQAAEVRMETTLYIEDGEDFYYYTVNDEYVTKEDYNSISERFVDPENIVYQMYSGTYDAPIKDYLSEGSNGTEDVDIMQVLSSKYGITSQQQFVSCLGIDIQVYPSEIYGIVSMATADINQDNIDEFIVLRVSKKEDNNEAQILSEIYQSNSGGITLLASQSLYNISFCAAANIYLFYSDVLNKYCIMVDSSSSGSYTGVNSCFAKVFTISENSIDVYGSWESVPLMGINIDFETELSAISAPYAKYCTDYDNRDSGLFYQPLCEIEHEIYGDSGSYLTRNHKLTIKNNSDVTDGSGIVVYSDYTNLSISTGSTITLSAGILMDGELSEDASGITFQIADTSVLSVLTTDIKNNCRYVKLKGLKEGTTTVVFSDSNTGYTAKVSVTVFDNYYHSYTLSNVPTQQIDKYETNFYNVNGLYIDSYAYTVNDDQSASVSFDVYNTNYTYGVVEVYDEDGNMTDAVLIEKMTSTNTSIKKAVWDNIGYLVRDIIDGDLLSYRQESGYSKKTSIIVQIPKNGYIKICIDPENSLIVGLVNAVDSIMSLASLAGDIKNFDANSKEFSEKLTLKLLTDKVYLELLKDGSKASKKLWKNVGKEIFITSESMGNFTDTVSKNIDELNLGSVIADTAESFGWNVGEKIFTYFSGPVGTALTIVFTIGKVENIIIQQNDLFQSAGVGSIYIQNQGGGIRSCQQIKVESGNGFSPDTALNVFTVTLDSTLLDIIQLVNPEVYEAMTNGITYTYNISLLKNGDETQPDGKVTVYIPIPEDLKVLAYAGEVTGGISGKVKIYRVEEDGNLTEMDVEIEDGCFVFTTDHFSLYTIVGFDSDDDTIPDQNGNDFLTIAIIGIAAVVIVCVGTIVIIIIKRKKK